MRYKDRQESPADFKDSKLSKPDSRSAEATQRGVSNTHAYGKLAGDSYGQIGEGVAKGIKDVSDFKEGYDIAKVEQEHNANINRYLNGTTEEQIQEAGDEAAVATSTEERMWDIFSKDDTDGRGEQIVDTINIATANSAKAIGKYATAKKQGRISAAEFVANSTRITREAIARHPTLADEILGSTRKLFTIAGVQDSLDLDKASKAAAFKKQEKMEDRVVNAYLEYNQDALYKNGEYDIPAMQASLAKNQIKVAALENTQRIIEKEAGDVFNDARELLKPNPNNEGGVSDLAVTRNENEQQTVKAWTASLEIAQNSPPSLRVAALRETMDTIRMQAIQMQQEYAQRTRRLYSDDEVKTFADNAEKRINSYVTMLEKSLDGGDVAKAIANVQAGVTWNTKKEMEGMLGMPYERFEMNMKIYAMYPKSALIHKFPHLANEMPRWMELLGRPTKAAQTGIHLDTPERAKMFDETAVATMSQIREDGPNEKNLPIFNNIINGQATKLNHIEGEGQIVKRMDAVITSWGSRGMSGAAEHITPENKVISNKVVTEGLIIYNKNMNADMAKARKLGLKINVKYDHGEVTFSGDGQTASNMAAKYTARVRDARKAMANLNGWDLNDSKIDNIVMENMSGLGVEMEASAERKRVSDVEGRAKAESNKANFNTAVSSKEVEGRQKERAKLKDLKGTALAEEQKKYHN